MITREVVASYAPPREILLASPPNRKVIALFALLSALNYIISIPAFLNGRWESYLSFILANICAAAAVLSYYARNELIILTRERAIRLRNGVGPVRFERLIPFEKVRGVR